MSTSNDFAYCINAGIINGTKYSLNVIVKYEATGYATEYYNIVNNTLSNTSGNQIITLYDFVVEKSNVTNLVKLLYSGTVNIIPNALL